MSVSVKYKANRFLSNLQSLADHFEYISKVYALRYDDARITFLDVQTKLRFYPNFYITRLQKLKNSLNDFFEKNEKKLSSLPDVYELEIDYTDDTDFSDGLQFQNIKLYVEDITEKLKLKKGLKGLKKKAFNKDRILIGYLINLEDMIAEKGSLPWEDWVIKYSTAELREEYEPENYNDLCFGLSTPIHLLDIEISELDKLAYQLQKEIIQDFDTFSESNPVTYVNGKLTERSERQLKELSALKESPTLKFTDKLYILADRVDGSEESLKIVMENLTVKNLTSLFKQILRCLPGVLTLEELIKGLMSGSYEAITKQFIDDILLLLPQELVEEIDKVSAAVDYPWVEGSTEFHMDWFETVIRECAPTLHRLGYPTIFDTNTVLTSKNYPSVMYKMLKMFYEDSLPDIDFKKPIPGLGVPLEQIMLTGRSEESFKETSRNGDKNAIVLAIQKKLNEMGFTDKEDKRLEEDSQFGNKTEQAVKSFQKKNVDVSGNRLIVDGIVGQLTHSAMYNSPVQLKDIFLVTNAEYEMFLLDLILLKINTPETAEFIGEVTVPTNIDSFTAAKLVLPNFKKRDITIQDYLDLSDYISIYAPEINNNELPPLPATIYLDGGTQVLSQTLKKRFFKVFYKVTIEKKLEIRNPEEDSAGLITTFPTPSQPPTDSIKPVFDEIFFEVKRLVTEMERNYITEQEQMKYSKLFTSKLAQALPGMAEKYKDSAEDYLSKVDMNQVLFEQLQKIPEVKRIVDSIMPEIRSLNSVDLNFPDTSDFANLKFRLPEVPKFPSLKFNFVEFVTQNLSKAIIAVIVKIFLTLLAKILEKIENELCGEPEQGLQQDEPDGGLTALVGETLCPDKVPEKEAYNLVKASMSSMTSFLEDDNSIKKVVEAMSACATIGEIGPAILNNKDKVKPGFGNKMSDIIKAVAPEFEDVLGTPEKIMEFFAMAGNQMSQQQRDTVQDLLDQVPTPDIPVSSTICLSKDALEEWIEDTTALYSTAGFDNDIAAEIIDRQRRRTSREVGEIVQIAINTPDNLFQNEIDSILNPPAGCDDLLNPPELKRRLGEISNFLLKNLNNSFVDDMLVPERFFGDFKGALSKILEDKHNRSMSDITTIKSNFFLNLLVTFGVLEEPEFPATIGEDLTKLFDDANGQNIYITMTEELNITPGIFETPLFKIPLLSKITQTVYPIKYKKPDMIMQYSDNLAIEYMDHLYLHETMNGIKLGIDIITARKSKEKEFIEKFVDYGFNERTKPKEIFKYLFDGEYPSQFQSLNDKVIEYMKGLFKIPIDYGYPAEIVAEDLEFSGGDNEQKILAQLVDGVNERVEILDPEIYGGSYERPKIFIRPPDENSGSGFYLYSKKLFSDLAENKLDNTILKLSQVARYIDDSQKIIGQERFNKAKFVEDEGDILEKPYSIMIPKQKMSNIWGFFKSLIRVYLAEFFTLAYPVVKKFGTKYENYGDLIFSYIEHRIEKDAHDIKNLGDPKSNYTPYIIYVLMLENIVIEHMATSKDELSKYFSEKKEDYTSLYEADLEFIKSQSHNSRILSAIPKYENFVRGFSVFSFGSNWKNVMNTTAGFKITAFNLDDEDIRLASKIGFIISDIDKIREIIKNKVIKEAAEYEEVFPPEIDNIYVDFMRSENGLNLDLDNIIFEPPTVPLDYYVKKYIKVTEKNGNVFETNHEDLLSYVEQYPIGASISSVLGNAEVEDLYKRIYSGTIGIMFGVSIGYGGETICRYEKDIEDVTIGELRGFDENLNQDVKCFLDKMVESDEGELFFKHCLKVEKAASLGAIFFMKNLIPSLGQGSDERILSITDLVGDSIDLVMGRVYPSSIYTTTKKEIYKNISSFMYNEKTDPRQSENDFSDFKKAQTMNQNFDFSNLKIKGGESIPYLKRFLITTYIETDENGNPLVNKFLSSHFSEE